MGGGTTRIGDPSGKDEARPLLTTPRSPRNMAGIRKVFAKFISFGDGPSDAVMVNNADWLDELRYIPLLRDIGRHFSVNRMLTQDSVKLRLERDQPLSFLEFNYTILQAYDFVELARRYDCALQMGGSDQWGNIVAGVELGRRVRGRDPVRPDDAADDDRLGRQDGQDRAAARYGSTPSGCRPTITGNIWRNTEDADVGRFLRLFTELPLAEIARLEALRDSEINEAKKILATEATALCHGRAAAEAAAETAREVFEQGGSGQELPRLAVPRDLFECGIAVIELFVARGLAASNSEARRLIRGGGARLNDALVDDETSIIRLDDLGPDGMLKLSAGRKRHALIRAQ